MPSEAIADNPVLTCGHCRDDLQRYYAMFESMPTAPFLLGAMPQVNDGVHIQVEPVLKLLQFSRYDPELRQEVARNGAECPCCGCRWDLAYVEYGRGCHHCSRGRFWGPAARDKSPINTGG